MTAPTMPMGRNVCLDVSERPVVLNYKRGMLNDAITWRPPFIQFGNP